MDTDLALHVKTIHQLDNSNVALANVQIVTRATATIVIATIVT